MRDHPEGVASLIAVMLVPEGTPKEEFEAKVDWYRNRVLELANQYYKVNNCDFDNSADKRPENETQNLAKLNRANLR